LAITNPPCSVVSLW